jgi:diaminopimelate decarboxylase
MIPELTSRAKHVVRDRLGPRYAARQPVRTDLALDHWDLALGDGRLTYGGVDLLELAATHGTPLHAVSVRDLERNAAEALAPLRAGAGTDIFYSYKTNPVPGVLAALHRHGIGAEVISPFELWLAMQLGVPADRIIYNGPAKSPESLRTAIEAGVLAINANSLDEASAIIGIAEELGRVVNLGLRVTFSGAWGGQFGIDVESPHVGRAVDLARASRFAQLTSLHVHRGRTMRTRADFEGYLGGVLGCCDRIREVTGWHPELLDIGGSLACPTAAPIPQKQYRLNRALATDLLPPDPATCLSVAESSTIAAAMARDHFASAGVAVPTLVQEPGRGLTGNTQLLLASVVDVKSDGALLHAVLDAGINVAEPVTSEYHQLFSVTSPDGAPHASYRLAGPICTPADIIYNNWRLPPLHRGHLLAIMDSGAYFVPFSTAFSFPRPGVVACLDGSTTVWRRPETFAEMIDRDRWIDDPAAPG